MKKYAALIVLALVFFAVQINAQPKPISKEQRIKELTEKLKLNSAQVKKVQQILGASEGREKKIDDKIAELHNELRSLRENDDKQIMDVLDKNQKDKFSKMNKENRPPMEKGQRPPAPDGDEPPAKK